MITTRSFMDQFWVDLNSPTKEEVDSLLLTQHLDPIIAKDLLSPTPTQHVRERDGAVYVVLHLPAFKSSHSVNGAQEVDFVITEKGLITARYDSIDALHFYSKKIEVNEILNRGEKSHLFFGMMKEIYDFITDELAYMEDWMRQIEENIFEGHERAMVSTISKAGRNLLNFKRIIDPHGNVLEALKELGAEQFGKEFNTQTKLLIDEWRRIMRTINNKMDLLLELRETNNSILSTKQNEIMKIFTILAFVTFPLSLVAAIFGMNTVSIPIIGLPYDFWIVLGIMFVMSLLMFAYFKHKKWM